MRSRWLDLWRVLAQDRANARRHREGLVHRGFWDFRQRGADERPKVKLHLAPDELAAIINAIGHRFGFVMDEHGTGNRLVQTVLELAANGLRLSCRRRRSPRYP
jgi:hypothetical protein